MQHLHRLITRLGLASFSEVNQAIFSHPQLGIVEALGQLLGEEREANILQGLAKSLNISQLQDHQVVLNPHCRQGKDLSSLLRLILAHRAIPVGTGLRSGTRTVTLAMANPLDEGGIQAFGKFYQAAVVVRCIARESAVMKAAEILRLQLRETARNEKGMRAEEDPDVLKAIQQVIATAVKHSVERVELDLATPYVMAGFFLPDGKSSSVEISVSTSALAAALLRRGQIVERRPGGFDAACGIEFKSSWVNCRLTYEQSYATEFPAQLSIDEPQSSLSRPVLLLSEFVVDAPDDPCFWLGMPESSAVLLREMLDAGAGAFIVASPEEEQRAVALRSILRSYPDSYGPQVSSDLADHAELLSRAADCRVLLGTGDESLFQLLDSVRQLPRELKENIRAVIAYRGLSRVCECCAEPSEEPFHLVSKIPDYIKPVDKLFRRGRGCAICDQSGVLGTVGVLSVIDMDGPVGKTVRGNASRNELAAALVRDPNFRSLLHRGIQEAGKGNVPLSTALEELPRPPEEFDAAYRRLGRTDGDPLLEVEEFDAEPLPDPEPLPEFETPLPEIETKSAPAARPTNQPISGSGVFYSRPRATEPKQTPAPQEKQNGSVETKELLLVIDDDPDQRAILRKVFELEGYQVEVAADGVDGIVSASRLQPQVIIVDFMMPEMDGKETISRLKQSPQTSKIPIVALTAYADPDVEYGLLKAGADDFCPKSVSKKVLLKRIERLVGRA